MTDDLDPQNTDEANATDEVKTPPANESAEGESGEAPTLEEWKSHARTWEKRAKESKADVEAKDARIASLEKELEAGKGSDGDLSEARAQSARYKAALVSGIDLETAEKVLTGADEATITAQAEAFTAAVESAAEKRAESATHRRGREDPNAGLQGAEKPDYKAQAEELRRKFK